MSLPDLAKASSTPARTIRFYISRGLLNGPVKAGRDAEYTAEHLACLERIKRLQSAGHTLSEIARMLGSATVKRAAPAPTAWWQYAVADDVVVWVKGGSSPWRTKHIGAAVERFASLLESGKEPEAK
jgi:DNA-binding transcriptional MerR regulator